jgi:hypothetical protein
MNSLNFSRKKNWEKNVVKLFRKIELLFPSSTTTIGKQFRAKKNEEFVFKLLREEKNSRQTEDHKVRQRKMTLSVNEEKICRSIFFWRMGLDLVMAEQMFNYIFSFTELNKCLITSFNIDEKSNRLYF